MKARLLRLTAVLAAVLLVFSFLLPNTQKVHAAAADQYGYSQLTPVQQYVYDQIVACVEARKPSADLDESKGVLVDDITRACDAIDRDRPDLFWFEGISGYSSYPNGVAVSVTTSYVLNGVNIDGSSQALTNAINAFKAACNEILNSIPLWATSEYDKALYLHDAVAARVTYKDTANDQNAYGALVEGKAVCKGYAAAYQYLLNQKGIKASMVLGNGIDPSGIPVAHAWNILWIGGKCVYTDVTWDDQDPYLFHAYFNRSLNVFNKDHFPSTTLPACGHEGMDYFTVESGDTPGVGILNAQTTENAFADMFKSVVGADKKAQFHAHVRCDKITVAKWLEDHNTDFMKLTGVSLESYGMTTLGDETQVVLNCRNTNVPVAGISLSSAEIRLSQIGAARQLGVKIMPADATNQKVSFRSSNPLVAVVDGSGMVRAIGKGTAEITVTTDDGGFVATCKVTVDTEHTHDDPLRKIDPVKANCVEPGREGYYTCDSCGAYFADIDGKEEISDPDSLIIPALDHEDGDSDGTCDRCGHNESDPTTQPTDPEAPTQPSQEPTEPSQTQPQPSDPEEPTQDSTLPTATEPQQPSEPQPQLPIGFIAAGAAVVLVLIFGAIIVVRKRG